jgi:FixJ family two-component response regulator
METIEGPTARRSDSRDGTAQGFERGLCCAVVEADESVQNVLTLMLSELRIESLELHYSSDVYDELVKACPELIILDLSIQEPQCWGLLECLQQGTLTRNIPIVCISTMADALTRAQEKYRFPGGALFLEKPFDIADVEDAIFTLIKT